MALLLASSAMAAPASDAHGEAATAEDGAEHAEGGHKGGHSRFSGIPPIRHWFDCKPKTGNDERAAAAEDMAPPGDPSLAPIDGRRVPGSVPPPFAVGDRQVNIGAVGEPPVNNFPRDHIPVPDRWRLVDTLGVKSRWFDPYNQNTLKGDRPLCGTHDLFLTLSAISDTVIEPRSFPTPVGVQTTQLPNSNDVFGRSNSLVLAQTFIVGAALTKGSTAFKPPEYEVRVALAFQVNQVNISERRILNVEPSRENHRTDVFVGVQELFLDYHLRNVSDRYDFDSLRIGIQPFSSDFRGFLFQDNQIGVRLFGDRDDNRFQYNLAVFGRLEKDTNSGLNDVTRTPRNDLTFIANLYRQDLPLPGITSQLTVIYNRNREAGDVQVDTNGFPVRPALIGDLRGRDYDVTYLGYNADGRIGRINLTASGYFAIGEDRNSIFTGKPAKIRAFFAAAEAGYDLNWTRRAVFRALRLGRQQPVRQYREWLRRHPGESAVRRGRHQLLDPPDHSLCRRRPGDRHQRPQRRAQQPAVVEGPGAIELQ